MTNVVSSFRGEWACFSNFFPRAITVAGVRYPSVEHFFQCSKCTDLVEKENIRQCATPTEAKHLGRAARCRPDWNDVRVKAMYTGVKAKFVQHADLRAVLLATDNTIVEGNTRHNNFWGQCDCYDCQHVTSKNFLGRILMKVRTELR